jgi:hypothetical protein
MSPSLRRRREAAGGGTHGAGARAAPGATLAGGALLRSFRRRRDLAELHLPAAQAGGPARRQPGDPAGGERTVDQDTIGQDAIDRRRRRRDERIVLHGRLRPRPRHALGPLGLSGAGSDPRAGSSRAAGERDRAASGRSRSHVSGACTRRLRR